MQLSFCNFHTYFYWYLLICNYLLCSINIFMRSCVVGWLSGYTILLTLLLVLWLLFLAEYSGFIFIFYFQCLESRSTIAAISMKDSQIRSQRSPGPVNLSFSMNKYTSKIEKSYKLLFLNIQFHWLIMVSYNRIKLCLWYNAVSSYWTAALSHVWSAFLERSKIFTVTTIVNKQHYVL